MAGNKRNQDIFQTSDSNYSNDKESICWKYFEPFKIPKEYGTETKCTIPGCTTKYLWCGSTSNHVGHLKNKHGIIKSSTPLTTKISTTNFINSELEINIPLIKFIISSGAPLNIVDNLKSAGFINPQYELPTSDIIEEQINKAYNRLFLQLKSQAQQEKSTMILINTIEIEEYVYTIFTCNWLTKDFAFHKILLCVKKFYSVRLDESYFDEVYEAFENLKEWAKQNSNSQEMSEIIKVIKNATYNLYGIGIFDYSTIIDIQNAGKIKCDCDYHKIAFLKLMKHPFIQLINNYNSYEDFFIRNEGKRYKELLLDSLPFSIFSNLLQLFKPLENIICSDHEISIKEGLDLEDKIAINADNMLKEPMLNDLEHEALKSFLKYIPLFLESNPFFIRQIASFLDPRSKLDEISPVIKKYMLKKCQAYYLKNNDLDKSIQEANKELECYHNRPQSSFDEDVVPYEWWQGSKQMLPGLAMIAKEYLIILTMDNEDPIEESDIKRLLVTYGDDMADKISFLQYNKKYIDQYL
ncbi:754_t:CDS:2 [Scutellospora calospora]|uniref:754_t:CDS:1 n=1 Tax=Scutellospora calospora TaxID=85575 RepID=A0ACA9KL56_9GLOM|nr:754_t:CDS:2 [Scutellospora calospora]